MILQSAFRILGFLPSCAILIAAIIILIRTKSAAGIFLVVGHSISMLIQFFWSVLYPILINRSSFSMGGSENSMLITGVSLVSFLGATLFAVGLFLLAYQHLGGKRY